jgi:hypothetical protein
MKFYFADIEMLISGWNALYMSPFLLHSGNPRQRNPSSNGTSPESWDCRYHKTPHMDGEERF